MVIDLSPGSLLNESKVRALAEGNSEEPERQLTRFASLEAALDALQQVWKFDCFSLEISLPATFAVRAQAMRWALADGFEAAAAQHHGEQRDLKEALRICLAERFTNATGCEFRPLTDSSRLLLSCRIEIDPADEAEASWLFPDDETGKKRRSRAAFRRGSRRKVKEPVLETKAASTAVVSRLAAMPRDDFLEKCPESARNLAAPRAAPVLILTPGRLPQYVGGRYLKLRRGLPQSPWIMDGQRRGLGESSVQEEIAAVVLPGLRADAYSFLSSGREDMDVRMMGKGRPFALEVREAREWPPSQEILQMAEQALAGSKLEVRVHGLRVLGAEHIAKLKEGEEDKRKRYAAVCWADRSLTEEDYRFLNSRRDIILQQETPIRVLHRRANVARERAVFELTAERLEVGQGYFLLRLATAAGTYVKEFVHGDRGRTRPSIAELLKCRVECVYLDVTDVEMEF